MFIIICLNFVLINMAPGDPALALAGAQAGSNQEYLEMLRIKFGLDKPIHERLIIYVSRVVQLDFGYSYFYRRPVFDVIWQHIPATLILMIPSFILAVIVGTLLGAYAAQRRGSRLEAALTTTNVGFYSLPVFWLGILEILVFALILRVLPTGGMIPATETGTEAILDILRHLILPTLALFLTLFPGFYLLARASVIEVMREDFITTFRAAGLKENAILYNHALRNAILPEVTAAGLLFGFLFAGSVLVETVFSWPGMGRLAYQAAMLRDYPLLMGIFIIGSAWFIIANLATDIAYSFLDPRVLYE
jgi:peptide/nickel transport system permease protein